MNTAITRENMDTAWLNYFRPADAMKAVISHVANLPSSKHEGHTMRVYRGGLKYFLEWASHAQPTKDMLTHFIAHMKHEKEWGNGKRGITASSISSRYLAPIRIYLKALAGQSINTRVDGTPLTLDDRHYVADIRDQLRAASEIPNPSADEKNNLPDLEAHGTRLTVGQINTVYNLCDRETLVGKRDLAFFYWLFNSAMRASEMSRVTLNKIKHDGDVYRIHVRGKGNNLTPKVIDHEGYVLLLEYVAAYNTVLNHDDPRRIGADTPVWQQIQFNDTPFPVGYQGRDDQSGLSTQSMRSICEKYSKLLSAELGIEINFTPHDWRRSYASVMKNNDGDIVDISQHMCHKSVDVTIRYVGPKTDWRKGLPGSRINQTLPPAPHQQHLPHAAG